MNKNSSNEIPESVLELLPWYAMDSLTGDDKAIFDKALSVYPLLKELLKQELKIVETVSADKTLLDMSVISNQGERLKSVFNMIDNIEEEPDQAIELSVFEKVKNSFDSLISKTIFPQLASIVGVGILVISIAILTAFIPPIFIESSEFIPASAVIQDDNANIDNAARSVLLVGFNGTPSELGNNDVLEGKIVKIEGLTTKEGFYQVLLKESLSSSEIKEIIDALLIQKEWIWFVGKSY